MDKSKDYIFWRNPDKELRKKLLIINQRDKGNNKKLFSIGLTIQKLLKTHPEIVNFKNDFSVV